MGLVSCFVCMWLVLVMLSLEKLVCRFWLFSNVSLMVFLVVRGGFRSFEVLVCVELMLDVDCCMFMVWLVCF